MRATVQAAIAAHRLIEPGERVVVAVSGGADSVCLARVLASLADESCWSLSLLHVNHGIRGADADADEAFVVGLAGELGLPFDGAWVDVPAAAAARGVSLEMAGRAARLRVYRETAGARGATSVALGHTRDDRVETFLMRLLRGSGGAGLSGLRAVRRLGPLRLVRPLLDVPRAKIERHLAGLGQPWREDHTNADPRFTRNRIRHELLPLLRDRYNAAADAALWRASRLLEQDEAYLAERAAEALARCRRDDGVDAEALAREPPALAGRLLLRWLAGEGVGAVDLSAVEALLRLAGARGGSAALSLPGGVRIERTYGVLRVGRGTPDGQAEFCYRLPVPGRLDLAACGLTAEARVIAAADPRRPGRVGQWPAAGCLNRERVGDGPLLLRSRRPGDRIRPLGLGGAVKLQDLFVDAKVPRPLRDRIPVVACRDQIVWIPGYRVAEGWEVRPGDPECVEVRLLPPPDA